jgi:hypothetical protein
MQNLHLSNDCTTMCIHGSILKVWVLYVQMRRLLAIDFCDERNTEMVLKELDDCKYSLLEQFRAETIVVKLLSSSIKIDLWLITHQIYYTFGKIEVLCIMKEPKLEELLPLDYRKVYVCIQTFEKVTFEDVKTLLLQDERVQQMLKLLDDDFVISEFSSNEDDTYVAELEKVLVDTELYLL